MLSREDALTITDSVRHYDEFKTRLSTIIHNEARHGHYTTSAEVPHCFSNDLENELRELNYVVFREVAVDRDVFKIHWGRSTPSSYDEEVSDCYREIMMKIDSVKLALNDKTYHFFRTADIADKVGAILEDKGYTVHRGADQIPEILFVEW